MRSMTTLFTVGFFAATAVWSGGPMIGFDPSSAVTHRALESAYDELLSGQNIDEWLGRLAARPHHVGSEHGRANAEMMVELFRSWGYEARIETFDVLFPTPTVRRLELVAPATFTATLREPAIEGDVASGQIDERLPPFNAYSIDGTVEGELVYVNYGLPGDYEELERRGVSVEGKIAIARYGGAWRGIKPKVAAEKGAIGCIIYSDPRDDGYFRGDPYPEGGYRGEHSVQRGSVADMPTFPGDPLTPGRGATADAARLSRDEAPTLTKIPVLPISYADAEPLLAAIGGPVAPQSWRGALPLTYHLGPGPARVRLEVAFDWSLVPAHDVIAMLPGREHPDQWIIRGNHHDAWANGATDPSSGMAALLEEARAIAELTKRGWRPRRTIVYAAWDAEEPGLLGSTEWVEEHARELRSKAAVYINTDSSSRGFLSVGGSHTLERLVNEVSNEVTDPQTGVSVGERRRARDVVHGDDEERQRARAGSFGLYALGSGSDYTPFLQHLGIASLNVGFGGEAEYGQYHSAYDSVEHYRRFMDPGGEYGLALARVNGRLVLRLADAPVLPIDPGGFVSTVAGYVDDVVGLTDRMRAETEELRRRLDEGVHELVIDPRDPMSPPEAEDPVPHLGFAPLRNALEGLERSAAAYEAAAEARVADERPLTAEERRGLDAVLKRLEPSLTRRDGLPGREWYVHHVYAPGFYTGYGVKTLPGVRENIEQRSWEEAERQIAVAAGVLDAFGREIERATEILVGEP